MPKRILVTGASGFFGSHFVEHLLKNTDWEIVCLVRGSWAGNLRRLYDQSVWEENQHRVDIVWCDLRDRVIPFVANRIGVVDYIAHIAADTHVDRSIADPVPFVTNNIVSTLNILEFALMLPDLRLFNYFSTDEVYGPAPQGVLHTERDPYNATNPYAASKAGCEQLVNAYANTYGLPVLITATMNIVGERQHEEKFCPLVIRRVLQGEKVTIHADKSRTTPGSRFYIHARNASAALLFLLKRARRWESVERCNIVGDREIDNLELAKLIADEVGKPLDYELVSWHASRPGHDLRYALDGSKLKSLGFEFPVGFEESLRRTIRWTLEHKEWIGL